MSRLSHSLLLSVQLTAVVGLTTAGCSTLFPGDSATTSGPTTATGCSAATTKHVAPGGYYVSGNSVCTAGGATHMFHGVDRPSLEWSPSGDQLSAADFQLMATWKANVVRIALNQDFWIAESPIANPSYPATVDAAVKWAEQAGMDVILDLHWSDAGTLGSCKSSCQQLMADTNSIGFWADVAGRYKDDGRVLFELYNEPHDVPWNVWKSGGKTSGGWTAAGMQQLYDAVRGAGADNLVIVGGLNYAFDLSGVPSNRISGYNILYATHPYGGTSDKGPSAWDAGWGFLTKTDPVILTEFGDGSDRAAAGATLRPLPPTFQRSSPTPISTPPTGPPGPGSTAAVPSLAHQRLDGNADAAGDDREDRAARLHRSGAERQTGRGRDRRERRWRCGWRRGPGRTDGGAATGASRTPASEARGRRRKATVSAANMPVRPAHRRPRASPKGTVSAANDTRRRASRG